MKEFLLQIFTWWNGATVGTRFYTRRFGEFVGEDEFGNKYYRYTQANEIDPNVGAERRWVIYNGPADASRVPPGWRGWLQHNFELPPTEEPPYQIREWEMPHVPNLTGTAAAYRPRGSQLSTGERPAATGDYVPWSPDE
jgi:NADH:ubiquinone oxidoreductase subunit